MTEDQQRQRKFLFIGGFASLGAFALLLLMFSAFDVEASGLTRGLSVPLLLAAAACFGGAFRIKRDARRNAANGPRR